jgi:hypothetical protein
MSSIQYNIPNEPSSLLNTLIEVGLVGILEIFNSGIELSYSSKLKNFLKKIPLFAIYALSCYIKRRMGNIAL